MENVNKLTLAHIITSPDDYGGIIEGLYELPVPDKLTVKKKLLTIPENADEYCDNICYGQRLYISKVEPNDFGIIFRYVGGYFAPMYFNEEWSEELVKKFVVILLTCKAIELFPLALRLVYYSSDMEEKEKKLLYREPTKLEKAAGIEKLNVFGELNSVDFLRRDMNVTAREALLAPYNECLVRFMMAKEFAEYQDRYIELTRIEHDTKSKKNT